MGKSRRKRKQKKEKQLEPEVTIVGPLLNELTERIRVILEEDLWYKWQRAIKNPKPETIWMAERVENALLALEELERRAAGR